MHQNNSSEFYLKNNSIPNYDIFTYSFNKIKTRSNTRCYNLFKEHFMRSVLYNIQIN